MNDHCVGRTLGGGTGLAVAGDRAIDQPRIDLAQRLVAEPEAVHHAGAEILDQDIGFRDQPMNERDRIGILEVEREASLSRIELAEIGAVAVADRRAQPHVVAFRRLDLDHLRADVGQQPRAIGARPA